MLLVHVVKHAVCTRHPIVFLYLLPFLPWLLLPCALLSHLPTYYSLYIYALYAMQQQPHTQACLFCTFLTCYIMRHPPNLLPATVPVPLQQLYYTALLCDLLPPSALPTCPLPLPTTCLYLLTCSSPSHPTPPSYHLPAFPHSLLPAHFQAQYSAFPTALPLCTPAAFLPPAYHLPPFYLSPSLTTTTPNLPALPSSLLPTFPFPSLPLTLLLPTIPSLLPTIPSTQLSVCMVGIWHLDDSLSPP